MTMATPDKRCTYTYSMLVAVPGHGNGGGDRHAVDEASDFATNDGDADHDDGFAFGYECVHINQSE